MRRLCDRRIDYYFAAITEHTAKMTKAMEACYVHSHNAEFKVRLACMPPPPSQDLMLITRRIQRGLQIPSSCSHALVANAADPWSH